MLVELNHKGGARFFVDPEHVTCLSVCSAIPGEVDLWCGGVRFTVTGTFAEVVQRLRLRVELTATLEATETKEAPAAQTPR